MEVGGSAAEPAGTRPGVPRVKTAVPHLSDRHVHRPRLLVALDAASDAQITLVSAPAGYGKTLLLAEWAARHPDRTAWVSLDEDDNEDHRFWSAVLGALGSCAAVPAANPLHRIAVPRGPSADPEFVASVVAAIDSVPGPVRLVLDDVHELTAPGPLHGLRTLVRDRPPLLQLVLATRTDPPLPVARLRLAGELCEIRARDLSFSLAEADTMLSAADVDVPPRQLRLLVEQTEGWAAGLRLAALSLREAGSSDRFLSDLVGNGRAVSDYLVGEILSRLPADTMDLLRAVSVCDQLSAGLAAALSGRSDAGEVLDALERETSLVLSSGEGRTWYRVHPLLRSHLRVDLGRRRPELIVDLHRRAADWFTAVGEPGPALAHARLGEDVDGVAQLLRRHAVALVAAGALGPARAALDWLGEPAVDHDPWLATVAALVAMEGGEPTSAAARLAGADETWPADPAPELLALRALVRSRSAAIGGDPERMKQADAAFPGNHHEPELVPLALLDRAMTRLFEGRRAEARALAETALDGARRRRLGYLTARGLTTLGAIAAVEGDFRLMTTMADQADAELRGPDWEATAGAALLSMLRAYGALLRAEPAACLELTAADPAQESDPAAPDGLSVIREALRGAALVDLGRAREGLRELAAARTVAAGRRNAAQVNALVAVLEHRAATVRGRGDQARSVLVWAEEVLGPTGDVLLMQARREADLGRPAEAIRILVPLLGGAVAPVLAWAPVEGRVLACQLALHTGRRQQARQELHDALALAAATDVVRPLAFGPDEVVDLMIRHIGSFGDLDATARQALAARQATGDEAGTVSLTARERAVLSLLPTERSLEEIAGVLTVSHSTVKTHVRAIYGKLGVSTRREAVSTARRHGVLAATP